jgi:hypothetical protein
VRDLAATAIAQLKRCQGIEPALLLDIQAVDGTWFYWSDLAGNYPRALDGVLQEYKPWIKSAGPLRLTKDSRTDAGDLTAQNLSGNDFVRDATTAITSSEFEGALVILRFWDLLIEIPLLEFHGSLSEPAPTADEALFRMLQLMDCAQYELPLHNYSETCPLRYKAADCGSESELATCGKTIDDCTARVVIERFQGFPPQASSKVWGGATDQTRRPIEGCVELGTPVEYYDGSEVEKTVEPCSEWVVLELRGEEPLAMHPDTLVTVFKKAKDLSPGDRIEVGKNGEWRTDGQIRFEQRAGFKVKRRVSPGGTYMAGTARVRLHNNKMNPVE